MSDRGQLREDPTGLGSAKGTSSKGLSPGVWVTGLIAVVLLLLAVFAVA